MEYIKLLQIATDLAVKYHAGQKYGQFDYTTHLKNVQNVLIRFGFNSDYKLLISAWLHDIIEDTSFTLEEVKEIFGEDIANIVWSVTNEASINREEKLRKT
jgi:GTP pyrophosphokinase